MIEKNILCETYFGKPSQLVKAEEILTSLQEKIKSGININPEKECKELENIFAQTFGFEKCFISFLPVENSFNAFTIPFFNDVNYSEKTYELIRDKNGIRYKYPKGKSLYIYVHNYGMRHLSTEKIMATIVHEIGHNFFLLDEQIKDGKIRVAQNYILSVLNYMFEYIRVYGYIPLDVFRALVDVSLYLESPQKYMYNIATNFEAKLSDRAQKEGYNADKTYNNPVIKVLRRSVKVLFSIITLPLKMLGVGFSALLSPLLINRSAFKKRSLATQSYNNEKFADNFAMMYGYSVGIADLFANTQKMYNDGDVYDHIPVVRLFNYLDEMLTSTALFFADEHPHSYKRVLLAKQKVEYEMKNVRLSESQRKELEDQLAKINNIINKAPAYKKMVNKQFMKIIEEKDKIGSNKYSSEEIFDSDKTILKKYIKEDSNALIETFFNYKMNVDDLEYLQANGYSFTPNEEEQRVYTENHKILNNLSMNNIDKLKSLNEDQLVSLLNSTNDYYKMTKKSLNEGLADLFNKKVDIVCEKLDETQNINGLNKLAKIAENDLKGFSKKIKVKSNVYFTDENNYLSVTFSYDDSDHNNSLNNNTIVENIFNKYFNSKFNVVSNDNENHIAIQKIGNSYYKITYIINWSSDTSYHEIVFFKDPIYNNTCKLDFNLILKLFKNCNEDIIIYKNAIKIKTSNKKLVSNLKNIGFNDWNFNINKESIVMAPNNS